MTRPAPADGRQAALAGDALKVARMYYLLDLTTTEIAEQLGLTRPAVSRLLTWARSNGLVEYRINDHAQVRLGLEQALEERWGLREVKVVPVHPDAPIAEQTQAVTQYAANHLSGLIGAGTVLAVAWGATVSQVAASLTPRPEPGMNVVQLTGSGNNNSGHGVTDATRIISQFARNWHGHGHLLPIPAYFDDPATKEAMYRERVVRRVRNLASRADIVLFSIGVPDANSYIYRAGYIESSELQDLRGEGVVGDIATVFFREDGSYADIGMNSRSTGPDLKSLRNHPYSICVLAGRNKLPALRGALRGGFLNTLILDEGTALRLKEEHDDVA
ncbi:MAG TPA: sugar-binding transcriptional regulator [Deinococcales bacterium]|nr:sugar-binding transcriptional regulator [Deinococcales bacterium]